MSHVDEAAVMASFVVLDGQEASFPDLVADKDGVDAIGNLLGQGIVLAAPSCS